MKVYKMQLSAYQLTLPQVQRLTPFVRATLYRTGITAEPEYMQYGDQCQWSVPGAYTANEKEFVTQELDILPFIAEAYYIGDGALAFYVGKLCKFHVTDIRRCAFTFDVDPKFEYKVASMYEYVHDKKYDAIWGDIIISDNDPFTFVESLNSGVENITVVQWHKYHYQNAEEYIQHRDREAK